MSTLNSSERAALLSLVRQRERVAKAAAAQHAAELMAEFEKQVSTVYKPSDHPIWQEMAAKVTAVQKEANEQIKALCRTLHIPAEFAPEFHTSWYARGANGSKERRDELRKVAKAEVDAQIKRAQAAIAQASVAIQERILVTALTSDAAQALLLELPTPQALLPPLNLRAIERIAGRTRPESEELDDEAT